MKVERSARVLGISQRPVLAVLLPFFACGLQWLLWPGIRPFVWFLFYPAVFFSAWIGSLWSGLTATVLSAALVFFIFLSPQVSFYGKDPQTLFSVGVFLAMGGLFNLTHERLRRANRQVAENFLAQADGLARQREEALAAQRASKAQLGAGLERAENALRESEERYRSVLDHSHDFVYRMNLQTGRFEYLSPSVEKVLGYTVDEFMTLNLDTVLAMIHPDDMPGLRVAHARLEETGEGEAVYRQRTKHGDYRWLSNHLSLTRDSDGRPLYRSGSMSDITESTQAAEALRESEERFRATFEQAAVGIAQVGLDGKWLRVNQKLCEIVGYTSEELMGLTFQDITHPDDLETDLAFVQRVLAGEISTYSIEKRYIRKDRSAIWIDLTVVLVRDDAGSPKYFISVVEDISARRRVEAELAEHRAHLEALVAARTQELTRRTEALETANKELDAFAYSVSHDLRSPLRGVDGYSKVLLDDYASLLDEDGKFVLSQIRSSAQEMGQLIDDLLSFSRMGRRELAHDRLDLGALAQEVVREIQDQHRGRTMEFAIAPDMPHALGDRAMIREVLRNLLGNAAKFTRKQETARIRMDGQAGGPECVYTISDNGVGFDMQYAEKLFRVFQRLHSAEEFEGTGIGLAIVQRIIHRHGGRVWAKGTVGGGAVFHFTLGPAESD